MRVTLCHLTFYCLQDNGKELCHWEYLARELWHLEWYYRVYPMLVPEDRSQAGYIEANVCTAIRLYYQLLLTGQT